MADGKEKNSPRGPLSILQVARSVLAAGLGVQSQRNRERDFRQGSAGTFVVAGVIATVLFIFTVYGTVRLVLSLANTG